MWELSLQKSPFLGWVGHPVGPLWSNYIASSSSQEEQLLLEIVLLSSKGGGSYTENIALLP